MIKKISAIVLALVLCLSVVVVPVSAVELNGAKQAFEVKFDKEYYNAGDTAIVSVYAKVAEGYEIGASYISIGLNSAVFAQADNSTTDIQASLTTNDIAMFYFQDPSTLGVTWTTANQTTQINNASTAEEAALYDQYLRINLKKNTTSGYGTYNGLPSEDFNADEAPLMQFELKVAEGLADGTPINAAITTGTISKNMTYMAYYSSPGSKSTTAKFALADTVMVAATATIGAPALAIEKEKQQIKFGVTDGEYNNTFAARTFVKFTNFSEVFDDAADALDTADGDGLLEVGFVYKVGAFDETTAKNYIADAEFGDVIGTEKSVDGYTIDRHAYVSTSVVENGYAMGATINNIPAADKTTNITVLAYAKYTTGGDPVYAYCPVSGTFETLYNTYYGQAFPG